MSTKSKHKPVTLAKSVAQFDQSDVSNPEIVETVAIQGAVISKKLVQADKVNVTSEAADTASVYRAFAERSLDQARLTYTKVRDEALALSGKIEESSTAITAGTSALQSFVVKVWQAQAEDVFGYFHALGDVKSVSDAIELQASHSRRALDSSLRQFKDLSALLTDIANKTSTPIRSALPLVKS